MPPLRTLLLGLLLALVSVAGGGTQSRPPAAVRLHHLHFRTDDITSAMAAAVKTHGGTRAIAPGLGVGIRVVDTYLLFDSRTAAPPEGSGRAAPSAAGAVTEATSWLRARGVEATASEAATLMLPAVTSDFVLDHISFATPDVETVVVALRAAGVAESHRTTQSVFYRADGLLLEMTRETEIPDAFWCPMHPDVRAPYAGTCPVCAMALVPIAPPRVGEYRVDVTPTPSPDRRGIKALKLRIRDPDSGDDVEMFAETHERLLHLFIVGRDLRYFAHEHPVRTANGFEIDVNLPPGAYMLIADFLPGGGYPQMVHRAIVTPGYAVSPFVSVPDPPEDLSEKVVDGVRITLAAAQVRDKPEAVLRFGFTDAVTGAPIRDLQLYLGSSGHLLVVSPDLTHSVHAHPEGQTSGPDVNFGVVFPRAGAFKVWIQIQRAGRVITAPFVVRLTGEKGQGRRDKGQGTRDKGQGTRDKARGYWDASRSVSVHGAAPSTRRRLPFGRSSGVRSQ
jgi:hypothetical protein